jgi:hypothetical protein
MARVDNDRGDGTLFAPPREVQTPLHRGQVPMAETSIDAHRSRDRAGDRARVLALIRTSPRTLDEVATIFGRAPNALSGRISELAKEGLIVRTGARRKTRAGASANIWAATGNSINKGDSSQ